MSTGVADTNTGRGVVVDDEKHVSDTDHVDAATSKVLADSDLMNDAFTGEAKEHEQGLWEAVKTHPKACFWAFIMCFTIVSFPNHRLFIHFWLLITVFSRSWSPSTCS